MNEVAEDWKNIHAPQKMNEEDQWKELIFFMQESVLEDPLFDKDEEISLIQILKVYNVLLIYVKALNKPLSFNPTFKKIRNPTAIEMGRKTKKKKWQR